MKEDCLTTPSSTKYNININSTSSKGPAWTISKTERTVFKNNGNNYSRNLKKEESFKAKTGEGPAYTFGVPDDKKVIDDKLAKFLKSKVEFPGPGSYDIEDKNKGPSYYFGLTEKNQRKVPKKEFYPPVGIYDLRKEKDLEVPCTVFSKEPKIKKRKISKRLILNPNYEILTTRTAQWSFGEGYAITANKENIKKEKEKKNIKNKDYRNNKLRSSTPLPSNKDFIHTFFGKEGHSYTFSKEKYSHDDDFDVAQNKKKNGPEPGKYNRLKYIPDTPSYTMGRKLINLNVKKNKENNKENPLIERNIKYDFLSLNKTSPSYSFGPKEGPILNKKGIKLDSRSINKTENSTPEIRDYNNDRIPQGPKYTFGEIRKEKKKEEFPGPTDYDYKLPSSGTFFTFSVKGEDEHIKQVLKDNYPGPGQYPIKDVYYSKNSTINPIHEKEKKKEEIPGPGAYKIPTSFDYLSTSTRESGTWNPNYRYV